MGEGMNTKNTDQIHDGVEWVSRKEGTRTISRWIIHNVGDADKTLVLNGEKCEILKRDWQKEESPQIITLSKQQTLPATVIFKYNCHFDIRKPNGQTVQVIVQPPYFNQIKHLNPVAIHSIPQVKMAAGLTGKETYIYNAWVQFAERPEARMCFIEILPASGKTQEDELKKENASLRAKAGLTLKEALAEWGKFNLPGVSTKTRARIKEAVMMYSRPEYHSLSKVAKEFNVTPKTVSTWLNTFTYKTGFQVITFRQHQSVRSQAEIENS